MINGTVEQFTSPRRWRLGMAQSPRDPRLSRGTLRMVAPYQAVKIVDISDEEDSVVKIVLGMPHKKKCDDRRLDMVGRTDLEPGGEEFFGGGPVRRLLRLEQHCHSRLHARAARRQRPKVQWVHQRKTRTHALPGSRPFPLLRGMQVVPSKCNCLAPR